MKKILAFRGSPRKKGNSTLMLDSFIKGINNELYELEIIDPYKININYCLGCLKCNVTKKCIQKNDDWDELSQKLLDADIIVFASPVYFHHFPAALKLILDRFRSFVKITMIKDGLIHIPWQEWKKKFVLLLSMGTVEDVDAQPIIDLFEYLREILGKENTVDVIKAKRVALAQQIAFPEDVLKRLYPKLDLNEDLAEEDFVRNKENLDKCFNLAKNLTK
ncbi:MAG: flavodoxin family protein [Bacteroidota bacterium]|nr:flavodoxin family protein [Bacteroidota bacterium]